MTHIGSNDSWRWIVADTTQAWADGARDIGLHKETISYNVGTFREIGPWGSTRCLVIVEEPQKQHRRDWKPMEKKMSRGDDRGCQFVGLGLQILVD